MSVPAAEILAPILAAHRKQSLLLDSNLLIVYALGLFDPRQLRNCRATKNAYSEGDFQLLVRLVAEFHAAVTTPQIVTEVSNHATKLPDEVRRKFYGFFKTSIIDCTREHPVTSQNAAAETLFPRFGVTDASILHLAQQGAFVISGDFALVGSITRSGGSALNFTHFRSLAPPSG